MNARQPAHLLPRTHCPVGLAAHLRAAFTFRATAQTHGDTSRCDSIGSTPWSVIAGLHSRPGALPQLLRLTGKTGQKRNARFGLYASVSANDESDSRARKAT